MFAIKTAKKSELHGEPLAVSTDKEMSSSANWQKLQYTPFRRMVF